MRIALIDPFFDESHKKWAEGFQKYSNNNIEIYSGSAHNWKWKMTGGTLPIATAVNDSKKDYNLFFGTDMLNIPLFKSMLDQRYCDVPFMIYFHENQITYPWSPEDYDVQKQRDHHYGLINYCSALISQKVFFNSNYHQDSFLNGLSEFMSRFPGDSFSEGIANIKLKSEVLPIGLDLPEYSTSEYDTPVFIWNHRWEYDKNPELFFKTLFQLKEKGIDFKLIVVGKSFKRNPQIFESAKQRLSKELIHFGFAKSKAEYVKLLSYANIVFVTSNQDFFGISIVEAIAAGCYPVLPDRLSYPEHIPPHLLEDSIYKKDEDVVSHLIEIIQKERYRNSEPHSDFVRKYEWQNQVDHYDLSLELKC